MGGGLVVDDGESGVVVADRMAVHGIRRRQTRRRRRKKYRKKERERERECDSIMQEENSKHW